MIDNCIGCTGYRYSYEDLTSGQRQYDPESLVHNKIVHAKYVDTYLYNGNPYIEALPFPYSSEEIAENYTKAAGFPSKEKFYQLNKSIQNLLVDSIDQKFRITLPYHLDLEEEFYRTLVQSYSKRIQDPVLDCLEVNNNSYFVRHGLTAFHPGEAVDCFSMLGVAGSGKSTAMNMVLDHYPQVIIHEFNGETIVQIVYLYVTCDAYSNFNGLYESIGKAIDKALGNGNHTIRDEISNPKNRSLAAKCSKVKELIRKYSIGIIIFDEIQNIDMTSTKENSIETLLILNNDTHCGMGVLGTEEAFSAMFSKDRTTRRFASFISASSYCEDGRVFENIVRCLFATQVFEEWVEPDEEMITQFYKESGGVIAYAVKLYQYLVKDYISQKNKPEVDAEYIQHISASKRKIIHEEIHRHRNSSDVHEVNRRRVLGEMHSYKEFIEPAQRTNDSKDGIVERMMSIKSNALQTLKKKYPNYTTEAIAYVLDNVIQKDSMESDVVYLAEHQLATKNSPHKTGTEQKNRINHEDILKKLGECF